MKFIYCPECKDIIRLQPFNRLCLCRKSSGQYIDGIRIVTKGRAVPLGFGNTSFLEAYHADRKERQRFDAFFIEEGNLSVGKDNDTTVPTIG